MSQSVIRTTLPCEDISASRARGFISQALRRLGCQADAAVAELLVTELVTNAVVHAGSEVHVLVTRNGPRTRVEVADSSPRYPRVCDPDLDEVVGRGLLLVDALAADWGSRPTGRGKIVWFELATDGRS
jgi:anti-sigma regulatory factor (Ser/Thr protein kinase)